MPWSKLPTSDVAGNGPEPTPLTNVLDQVLAGMGAPRAAAIIEVHEGWQGIVGAELADHAQPLSIEDGCLRVGVDSPAWASHLRWSEREIVARIDRLVEPGVVTSVTTKILRR